MTAGPHYRLLRVLARFLQPDEDLRRIALALLAYRPQDANSNVRDIALDFLHLRTSPPDPELYRIGRRLLAENLPAGTGFREPAVQRRNAPVPNTWVFQNEMTEWDIPQGDLVLDIGCGGWPFKRADHLADKFTGATSHRTEALARDERPFIEVDLERLPFKDQAYDFIFCSHVLEHMEHPGQAMRELMRVGRRGYIEVPTRLSDIMLNFTRIPNHHRWHGLTLGKTLMLVEWPLEERRDLGNAFFDELQSEYLNDFQVFFERNRDLFFSSLHWNGSFSFLVVDRSGAVIDSHP